MGYNYGGLNALATGNQLEDFNYEQQADIIEDAFRLANGYRAQWVPGAGGRRCCLYYQPYLAEIRDATFPLVLSILHPGIQLRRAPVARSINAPSPGPHRNRRAISIR